MPGPGREICKMSLEHLTTQKVRMRANKTQHTLDRPRIDRDASESTGTKGKSCPWPKCNNLSKK